MNQCEKCGRRLVLPSGPEDAEILLVGDAPSYNEIKEGQPWIGPAGDVLRTELRRVQINPNRCRITNMWLHGKTNECEAHIDELMAEMQGRKVILLMGADCVTYFTGQNVSDVSGLRVDKMTDMLPAGVVAYAIFNPAIALHEKLGEVRFAMEKFAEGIR